MDPRRVVVPPAPGVYFLLGSERQVLYVGKASDLRRRLAEHARAARWSQVAEVRYELTGSPASALAREADLLAALRPPWNKSHVDGYFAFVSVTPAGLALGHDGDFGCFPHLGKGAVSDPGRACIDGFDALQRIVGTAPPAAELVHAFLSGRSDRLLRVPLGIDQPHIRHGVERDRRLAAGFYRCGPLAMRRLRLRHGGRGKVTAQQFVEWITEEVAEMLDRRS